MADFGFSPPPEEQAIDDYADPLDPGGHLLTPAAPPEPPRLDPNADFDTTKRRVAWLREDLPRQIAVIDGKFYHRGVYYNISVEEARQLAGHTLHTFKQGVDQATRRNPKLFCIVESPAAAVALQQARELELERRAAEKAALEGRALPGGSRQPGSALNPKQLPAPPPPPKPEQ
jgi:hypothetical protein